MKVLELRIWQPKNNSIRKSFYLKREILFGSDKSCDFQLQGVDGFFARLDTEACELHRLSEDRVEAVGAGDLFQLREYIFQWGYKSFSKKSIFSAAALTAGLVTLLITYYVWPSSNVDVCSSRALMLASGDLTRAPSSEDRNYFREIKTLKKRILESVNNARWVLARSELSALKAKLEEVSDSKVCGHFNYMKSLQEQFTRKMIYENLTNQKWNDALSEWKSFRDAHGPTELDSLKRRFRAAARKLYLDGYKTEERDIEKGDALMSEARTICQEIGDADDCFRSSR